MKRLRIIWMLIFLPFLVVAQSDSTTSKPKKFTVKGYVKYLAEASFTDDATQLLTNELLHNRLNFKYQFNDYFNLRLELRNRLYYGEFVKSYPGFANYITNDNSTIDLSENWINKNAVLFTTTIDRASAEYTGRKWDIILGRQRINWGINTVWTPNDIFNTFNYFDFDYEERPGSDAVRVKYLITDFSSLEVAVKPGKTESTNTAAMLYRFNKWKYDFQVFSGVYNTNFTAGAGWAGNIKDAGFKGEVSYFTPYNHFADSNTVAATISFDYAFKNGLYIVLSGLYNNAGQDSMPNIAQFTAVSLSAKNIFPFKYTAFAQVSYPFSPIFNGSLGTMYSPAGNAVIVLPTLSYSIADNWVLDLVAQTFFAKHNNSYGSLGNSIYLRIKWGF